jgi:hypothetical protein
VVPAVTLHLSAGAFTPSILSGSAQLPARPERSETWIAREKAIFHGPDLLLGQVGQGAVRSQGPQVAEGLPDLLQILRAYEASVLLTELLIGRHADPPGGASNNAGMQLMAELKVWAQDCPSHCARITLL